MTIALDGRIKAEGYRARHSVEAKAPDVTAMMREITIMFRATMALAVAGLVFVLGSTAFRSSTGISAGSWMVILAGTAGYVLIRAENMVARFVGRSWHGSTGGHGTDDPETTQLEEPQGTVSKQDPDVGPGGQATDMRPREGRGGSGNSSDGSDDEGASSLRGADERGRHRVAGRAVGASQIRVRPQTGGRARERFAVVRDQVDARGARGRVRGSGPSELSYFTPVRLAKMRSIPMWR